MSDWQPRDTAPKDGTEILTCCLNGKYSPDYAIVWWNGREWRGRCDGQDVAEYMSDFGTDYASPWFTHWVPLPKPPH